MNDIEKEIEPNQESITNTFNEFKLIIKCILFVVLIMLIITLIIGIIKNV